MDKKVNFGNVANDYAKYRDELPSIIFDQMKERKVDFQGKSIIDMGSGTGIFSRVLTRQGASVCGVEPESSLISLAEEQDNLHQLQIKYFHSKAEDIWLPGNSYDGITALRAWHWFDRTRVNQQAMRLLKINGFLIVIHSVFVPQSSEVAQETLNIVREHIGDLKPAGAMAETKERRSGLPANWFDEWKETGFTLIDEWQYDYSLDFTIEDWCGKIRTISWLTNENEETKQAITAKIKEYLHNKLEPVSIPHRYSVVILQK